MKLESLVLSCFMTPLILMSCADPPVKETNSVPEQAKNVKQPRRPIVPEPVEESSVLLDEKSNEVNLVMQDQPNDPGEVSELKFGIKNDWFSKESARFRNRILNLEALPENIPPAWFSERDSYLQAQILTSQFIWGKRDGKVILGILDKDSNFLAWPGSRTLDMTKPGSFTRQHVWEYPFTGEANGEVVEVDSF